MNRWYNSLTPARWNSFHSGCADLFRPDFRPAADDVWNVEWEGMPFRLPLRRDLFSVDWGQALTLLGHDQIIKNTYARLMKDEKLTCMLDIGANFGQHSLLFLKAGIPTYSFEPNPVCHTYLLEAGELNGVKPELIPSAVGESPGTVSYSFPAGQTWLGTTVDEVKQTFSSADPVNTFTISQVTLDSWLPRLQGKQVLIKIDTEGAELGILLGGTEVLREVRPLLVFECWKNDHRAAVMELLTRNGYDIYAPRRIPGTPPPVTLCDEAPLTLEEATTSPEPDFFARPHLVV